ncbi:MAG TPA: coagulation factor 5/8 type domain-containing protein [Thermoanaerobaculia bacterium]|nr:coagulation factor 5/8 type domain-containing protein [Thermoanaerobaculia bacterium]
MIDASGENVWWLNRRDFDFPRDWTTIRTKKRQIEFAWGPLGGGELKHVAAIEIVVTAGSGGKGSIWFTDPVLEPLPPTPTEPLRFTTPDISFEEKRELGGLTIDWKTQPEELTVYLDGVPRKLASTRFVWLPDSEAKSIRIEGGEVAAVTVQPPAWAKTANDFASIVARDAPRGAYPRYLIGEQAYWTIVGADGAEEEALVGEDGNVEPFIAGESIEPFLHVDGKRLTWADVKITQALMDGDLPIPSVTWTWGDASMTVTAAVSSSSMLQLHYRVRGNAELELQVRPFQVNPSTQFLNVEGGVAREQREEMRNLPCTRDPSPPAPLPTRWGEGGRRPGEGRCRREVRVDIPLRPGAKREPLAEIARHWREKLDRVAIEIAGAPQIAKTIRTNIAYTLIARDGPSLEPGTRSYDRAWIRDGALISSLLLRLGHADAAKQFAEWFASFQYDDGKVPCCVDRRGSDPVPENDSHGQLIFLIAEIHRYTNDLELVRKLWPHVDKAARYIEKLRSENHGRFEGLVTESISHEGYSAKAVHSYWDDVFALKGMEDAVYLANVLGLHERRNELEAQAADFRADLAASIRRTIEENELDYVPASVELADYDPTSTSIGISPLGLASLLPPRELQRTYERYFTNIAAPRDAYTPYEMRNIGALIRLGERNRALQLVDRFLLDRRPLAWNHWAEVVGTEYRKPRFIGDMPHVWVASDFTRSILDAIAYDREDGALVIGAGVPERWLPIHVGPLRTYHGTIDIRIDRGGVTLSGDAKPPNGIIAGGRRVDQLPARIPLASSKR